jgi:hypothetical protein
MNAFRLVLCLAGLALYALLRPLAHRPPTTPSAPALPGLPAAESPSMKGSGHGFL